jgi:hypothetical protein
MSNHFGKFRVNSMLDRPSMPARLADIASPKLIARIERRFFMQKGLSLGALALLAGCDATDGDAVDRFLWSMSRWNDGAQAALFNPNKLAPE